MEEKELAKQYIEEMIGGSVSITIPDSENKPTKINVFLDGFSSYAHICKVAANEWYVTIDLNGKCVDWKSFKKVPYLSNIMQLIVKAERSYSEG